MFEFFLRANPNTDPIPIHNLAALEYYVRVLFITVLGLEENPNIKLTCLPEKGKLNNIKVSKKHEDHIIL